jgi:hypothetical protein
MKRIAPGVVLLFLAPALGELVSGHQPPLDFLNPLTFIVLCLPYGFGALLCRELAVRWKKGWPSLLLLALAYGLYEEGIVVRSIFDPHWGELEALAQRQHFVGVNWVYTLGLLHFHVLISIGASVKLAEILCPTRRQDRWLSNAALIGCVVGLVAWLPCGWLMTQYRPPAAWHVGAYVAVTACVVVARYMPTPRLRPARDSVPRPIAFFLLGLANNAAFFMGAFATPKTGVLPAAGIFPLLLVLDGVTFVLVIRWSGNARRWDDRHRLAWIAGLLGFLVLCGVLADLEGQWTGKSIVSAISIVALWWLYRRVKARIRLQGADAQEQGHRAIDKPNDAQETGH